MFATLLAASLALQAAALQASLIVRVLDDASRLPLPNAEVIDRVTGAYRFTNEQGEAPLPWPGSGELSLRVRQLGFHFVDRTVAQQSRAAPDTALFFLQRVAYVLPRVLTTASSTCALDGDSAGTYLSAAVLQQLRLAAERYEAFRRTYPFRVRVERSTGEVSPTGDVKPTRREIEQAHSDKWGERYRPDRIIERSLVGFTVPILFVSALADPLFWERHCFAVRGVESFGETRMVRLEFAPKEKISGPEWQGAALVDSASSVLRRVEFHLSGLKAGDRPRRFEGYTTFRSPSPFIVVPDSTTAVWWRRDVPQGGEWGMPDVVQRLTVQSLTFLKATPPEHRVPPPQP